jgi:hypothetical protein
MAPADVPHYLCVFRAAEDITGTKRLLVLQP